MTRIGVIGFGYWGPNLVRNFLSLEEGTVSMVADLSERNLAKVRKLYPAIETTTDSRELISSSGVDAVAIATPVRTHYPLALAALQAGKHVLIEKPMAANTEQAEHLIEVARRNGCLLAVDHTFVFTGAVRKMREMVDSGALGELYYYDSTRINLGLLQEDVNVIWDLAPHDLAILNYLIDEPPTAVQAIGYSHVTGHNVEMASLNLEYASGFHAHLRVSWLSPVKLRTALLAGRQKKIVYDDVEPTEKLRVYDKGIVLNIDAEEVTAQKPIYRAGDVFIPNCDRTEALAIEAAHFVDAIQNGTAPLCGGQQGLAVVRLLEAADESISRGGEFVPISGAPREGRLSGAEACVSEVTD